jgi:hypothetical protein
MAFGAAEPLYSVLMGVPVPVQFDPKSTPSATIVVATHDGQKFDLKMAILVYSVVDQGLTNPLDGMPIFQVASQIVMQVERHIDG